MKVWAAVVVALVLTGRVGAGDFVRMFPNLDPYQPPDEQLVALAASMADPNLDAANNPLGLMSGFTYLGQFLDHDLTLDRTPLAEANDVAAMVNSRTARLDLDSAYGGGPDVSPQLYNVDGTFRLSVAPDGLSDLPRESTGRAILVEGRNDENLILAQIHLAFLRYHNKLMAEGLSFDAARQRVTYVWEWVVVHELLPHFCGQDAVDEVLSYNGAGKPKIRPRLFKTKKGDPAMPIEFAAAAYRFGHSMVRLAYDTRGTGTKTQVFNAAGNDLHGGRPIPPNLRIVASQFFDMPGVPRPGLANISRKVDSLISRSLLVLPSPLVVEVGPPAVVSLPERNLLRAKRIGLPSYESVAAAVGVTPLSIEQLGLDPATWDQAPLWYGILKESEVVEGGARLGPTGAAIVVDVVLALLEADKDSYVNRPQAWAPPPNVSTIAQLLALVQE